MNILFFIITKDKTQFVLSSFSLRQTLEKMESCGYTSLPIINDKGEYIATITEGDILRYVKKNNNLTLKSSEKVNVLDVNIKKVVKSIKIYSNMEDLIDNEYIIFNHNFIRCIPWHKEFSEWKAYDNIKFDTLSVFCRAFLKWKGTVFAL